MIAYPAPPNALALAGRSFAVNGPLALCVCATVVALAWLLETRFIDQVAMRRRSAFLQALARTSISHADLARYSHADDPVSAAEAEMTAPGTAPETQDCLRSALAAAY